MSLSAFWGLLITVSQCARVASDWAGNSSVSALVVVHQLVEFLKTVVVKHTNTVLNNSNLARPHNSVGLVLIELVVAANIS